MHSSTSIKAINESSLLELSLDKTVDNFLDKPFRLERRLSPQIARILLERLPPPTSGSSLALATYIDSDEYWKRATENEDNKQAQVASVAEHGHSHKRLYFETAAGDLLTLTEEDKEDRLSPIADLIHTLRLSDIQHPLLLDVVCNNLMNIDLKQVPSREDCLRLPKALASSQFLTSLAITQSSLVDNDVELIVNSLVESSPSTLLQLDFSYNKITSKVTKVISEKILVKNSVLCSLDLSGNKLGSEGASIIGQKLETNQSLLSLTLKLNNIGDKGGQRLIESLHKNITLNHLNLSANKLGSESAVSLLKILKEKRPDDSTLQSVFLTSNLFSKEDLINFKECKTSCFIDLRSTREPTKANKAMLFSEMP